MIIVIHFALNHLFSLPNIASEIYSHRKRIELTKNVKLKKASNLDPRPFFTSGKSDLGLRLKSFSIFYYTS